MAFDIAAYYPEEVRRAVCAATYADTAFYPAMPSARTPDCQCPLGVGNAKLAELHGRTIDDVVFDLLAEDAALFNGAPDEDTVADYARLPEPELIPSVLAALLGPLSLEETEAVTEAARHFEIEWDNGRITDLYAAMGVTRPGTP